MRFILSFLMLMVMVWFSALLWFLVNIPTEPLPAHHKADAIIVLTGGSGRVEHGLEMLAEGAAPVLFISGVGEHATEAEILDAHATQAVREKIYETNGEIVLDHVSRSTVSNAGQSVAFIKQRGIQTIRLVTADYHMQRSLAEFYSADTELEIFPDPVFPEGFHRTQWWEHDNTRRLVFSEFYKYYAVLARDALRPMISDASYE